MLWIYDKCPKFEKKNTNLKLQFACCVLICILCGTWWVLSCVWTTIIRFGNMPGTYNMDFKILYFDCLLVDYPSIKMIAKCNLIAFTIQPCQFWCNNHEHIAFISHHPMFQHSSLQCFHQEWSETTITNIYYIHHPMFLYSKVASSSGVIWSKNHEHV